MDQSTEPRLVVSAAEERFDRARKTVGLAAGPLLFALLLVFPPAGLELPGARLVAVLAWVLVWWITEAVPIPVTALLGPALGVVTGVGDARELLAPFGDPIIFLFMGSFILAAAMAASGLDRRFAFALLSLRAIGSSPARIVAAFASVTAVLSMWLSNSAVAAMMYPIALSLVDALSRLRGGGGSRDRFAVSALLATAYAASIGGIATPVGTPPNLIAIGQLETLAGVRIDFFAWMLLATPLMLLVLALLIGYLRLALPAEGTEVPRAHERILEARRALGPWRPAERNVLVAFGATVMAWLLPGVLGLVLGADAPLARWAQQHLPEGVVALLGAALLFVLPVDFRARRFTIGWREAAGVDWGTLLLFGGGLSLGAAMFRTGVATELGEAVLRVSGAESMVAITFVFGVLSVVLTETTSNTATATMLSPLAIAVAQAAHVSPLPPTVTVAICASMAFLLPVSTPPNAIVYGSGRLPLTAMLRHGGILDLASMTFVPAWVLVAWRVLGP